MGGPRKKNEYSSSSGSTSSSDEWVEKEPSSHSIKVKQKNNKRKYKSRSASSNSSDSSEPIKRKKKEKKRRKKRKSQRSLSSSSYSDSDSSVTSPNLSKYKQPEGKDWLGSSILAHTTEKEKKRDVGQPNRGIIDSMGQSERELNPYWKAGGSGLPSNSKAVDLHVSNAAVGDKGLEWYKKALRRAEDTAKSDGRPLEEVVAERWGSLDKLLSLIAESSKQIQSPRRGNRQSSNSYDRNRYSFKKPGDEFRKEMKDESRGRNWMKKESLSDEMGKHHDSRKKNFSSSKEDDVYVPVKNSNVILEEPKKIQSKILSNDELNALAAKLVKAEILGNTKRIAELKTELESARKAKDYADANKEKSDEGQRETVLLLHSNEKGVTCPVQSKTESGRETHRKKKRIDTHVDGQRVRYFTDDDKYSLQEMFIKEKLLTTSDDKQMFLSLNKRSAKNSDDECDSFVDAVRVSKSSKHLKEKEMQMAISEANKKRKTFENCNWCLDNPARAQHLVVSISDTCYLCLPEEESLTDYHCLLVPREHCPAGTLLDENVWEDLHNFRKALWKMAQMLDQDLIIFEQSRSLYKYPHTVFHCVILEKEVGDLAPIYFKKAILESDSEWGQNKKLVELKNQDVRGTIPKGLPYFSVEFGVSGGFAHVIEDEQLFKKNFAHSVIGGMLDLDHHKWRKATKTTFHAQRQKVAHFSKTWREFDFTKKLAAPKDSTSDSSDSDK